MSSKGFNPYITVADDVSPLYLLTLFLIPLFLPHLGFVDHDICLYTFAAQNNFCTLELGNLFQIPLCINNVDIYCYYKIIIFKNIYSIRRMHNNYCILKALKDLSVAMVYCTQGTQLYLRWELWKEVNKIMKKTRT